MKYVQSSIVDFEQVNIGFQGHQWTSSKSQIVVYQPYKFEYYTYTLLTPGEEEKRR